MGEYARIHRTLEQIADHPGDCECEPCWGMGICELCGEPYDMGSKYPSFAEVGEFATGEGRKTVIAHGQCGIDHGLEMA